MTDLRSGLGVVLALALGLSGGGRARAADGETVTDPVRAMLALPDVPPARSLIRITRDYNNDGREDLVLGFDEACGNKTCWFELFLRTPDGRYRHVGALGGLPFGYRIVPLRAGAARLETCAAIGDDVSHAAVVISMNGVEELPGRGLSEDEAKTVCKWPGEYVWETCALDRLGSTGGCSWTRRTWPQ